MKENFIRNLIILDQTRAFRDVDVIRNVKCAYDTERDCFPDCAACDIKKDNGVWCLRGHFFIGKLKEE